MKLKGIIRKYFNRNKDYLFSDNILYEMNGAVLLETNDKMFDFNGDMAEEVRRHCQEVGYKIDKIVFMSSYDAEVNQSEEYNLKMHGDSKIKIVEEYGQIVAVVCMGDSLTIKDKKYAK